MGRIGSKIIAVLLAFVIFSGFAYGAWKEIKDSNVAGQFYPAEASKLKETILAYLRQSTLPEDINPKDVIVAFSPHAGYIFSGPVAGYTYKLLRGGNWDTIIILGPSHFYPFNGIRAFDYRGYKTPLGIVEVDKALTEKIVSSLKTVSYQSEFFEKEHSLEVQLPFLQVVKPKSKVVLLLFGSMDLEEVKSEAHRLYKVLEEESKDGKRILVLVSSDMSHYYPYRQAVLKDLATIDCLRKLSLTRFFEGASVRRYEMCGWIPAAFAITLSNEYGNVEFRLLKYANSGDTYGNKSRVVGYMSAVIIKKRDKEVRMFTKEQRAKLLKLARRSIEHYLRTGRRLDDLGIDDPALYKEKGAFVTLKKNGMLRGCIGHIIADMPLCEVVAEMAIQAAVGDPRFPAVTMDELPEIEIEISVLSPLKKVEDINDIKIGKHGLLLRKGFYSGLLLPQVPVEYGWDRMTFLRQLAVKAGLPPDEWQGGELYSFTAEVFSESEVFGEDEKAD